MSLYNNACFPGPWLVFQFMLSKKEWESFQCLLANSRQTFMYHLLATFIWPLHNTGLISGVLQKKLSFCKVLLSPKSNAGALWQWLSGSWSLPWIKQPYPDHSIGWKSWWFQTSSIYGWRRPLCTFWPSTLQKVFCHLPQTFFTLPWWGSRCRILR